MTDRTRDIETAVKLLAQCHGKQLPQAALERWVRKLLPYADRSALWVVLERSCDLPKMPAVPEVIEQVFHETKIRERAEPIAKQLTEQERKRADHAGILSMLWLHYNKKWDLSDFAGTIFERCFGRNPQEALQAAKAIYSHDYVDKWMQHQIEIGN